MTKHILSIDQGTTSCRAIVFDKDGATLGAAQKEFTQYFPQPSWVEHDASEILAVQVSCIKDAIKNAGITGDDIACVGISNQRETTVVWNRETGKPIHNAIVWQCRRTAEVATQLGQESDQFRQKTGLIPDAYFSGPKVQWILENVSGARALAENGKLAFGTIDTWLIWNLTADRNHLTEPSNASRTMVFNIHSLDWDDDLLNRLSIPRNMMPQVVASNAEFGLTDKNVLGFAAPIRANLGDQQSALFGQACLHPGMAKCTYGTGTFLLANIGAQVRLVPGLLTTIAWQLENAAPAYALEGAIFTSGAAIQWLRDGLGVIASSEESEALANSITSNDGVYFVPALVGLGSPWWNSDVRGTIVGLTRGSGKAHFVRAALEAMAYQVADVASDIRSSGISLSELRVDGGATRNGFMLQFQSDVLNIPVIRSAQLESTAWGVAALAAIKSGLFSIDDFERQWRSDLSIKPSSNRSAEYESWRNALKAAFAAVGREPALHS